MVKTFHYFNDPSYPIQVTDETTSVTKYTFQSNGQLWENDSIQQFFSVVDRRKNCNIVDIGAQSGLYSLFAKFLPNATFYAYEPFPDTFRLLNDNLKLNGITNVKTFNLGVSNTMGESYLNTCRHHNGLHTMGDNLQRFEPGDNVRIKIQTKTLDSMFSKVDIPVHYIKIDTEGWEYFILLGAKETIQKYHPAIQLEWNPVNMKQCGVNPELLRQVLNELNYHEVSTASEEKLFLFKE